MPVSGQARLRRSPSEGGYLKQFTAADGARIAYADEGRGRPLVLLHGLMAHRGFYDPQAALADEFRLVTVDLRGHGASVEAGEVFSPDGRSAGSAA